MDASLSWIKAYVPDLNCTDREFLDAMTLSGTKGEGFHRLDRNLEKIVVGRIERIDPHPDADKLVVCTVRIAEASQTGESPDGAPGDSSSAKDAGLLQIVTGAPNVAVGQLVPVVLDGGRVAGGHDGGPMPEDGIPIRAGKLRGVESQGMMCSIEELGSSRDFYPEAPENGIYVFSADGASAAGAEDGPAAGTANVGDDSVAGTTNAGSDSAAGTANARDIPAIGTDAVAALGLRDTVFEFEITSNRVDCYSILGIAREAAATFDLPFHMPEVSLHETPEKAADYVSVEVKDTTLCTRYCARVCTDIKIAPSPKWMQRRLSSCGIRPINNLVDITNYVMLEYGQPMHAFDLDTVAGHKIIVRRANDGDVFTTLDGQERKLDHDVLMICDAEKEIGIAGIMGGENSMITDSVRTVLFEAATFNGPNIRKSSKRLGHRTDASSFFEKGLDPANAEAAINRACQLVEALGCGRVTQGIVEAGVPLKPLRRIAFDRDRINALLGTDISGEDMIAYLKRVEVTYDAAANEFIVPSFRQDLFALCDIAEEVARFYGYDKIPTTLPTTDAASGGISFQMVVEGKAREIARYAGFSQGYCYSFESPRVFDRLLLPKDAPERQAIRISNPLGEDFSVMRTISLNGILTSLAANYNHRNKNVRLYELGNIYLPKALPLTELPDERMQWTLGFYGDGDFYTMKGVTEEFLTQLGMRDKLSYRASARPYFHPGRQAEFLYGEEIVGFLGEMHPEVCENYDFDGNTRVYLAVVDIPAVLPHTSFDRVFEGIARFPAVTRDISMVVPKNVLAGDIEKMIRQRGGKDLESVELFDIYEGEQIGEGFKSMAYSLAFRNKERTLSDEDVNADMKKILNGLNRMGIELRS